MESAYKERIAAAQAFIDATDLTSAPWPPDIPHPPQDRSELENAQYQAAYDLTLMAVALLFLHEFRHVMFYREGGRPADDREEEIACDVWAREFMTVKLATYAQQNDHSYEQVLQKRSMAFALASLMIHETTPLWQRGGNQYYFSVATRLQALLHNTPLPEDSCFWVFAASLLIGIFRQRHSPITMPSMNARDFASHLIGEL